MNILLALIIALAYIMVISKRITTLINTFALQSFFLFLVTLLLAAESRDLELYVIAALVLALKVMLIPYFLKWVAKKINVDENLGLLLSPMLSLISAVLLSYAAYNFASQIINIHEMRPLISFAISLSVILTGLFIMVFRMKAITQVVGLLVMENGLFLSAVALCGNMPFFVEIAIFLDVFICVIILGIFIFRINQLFTHIDVDKLTKLKG